MAADISPSFSGSGPPLTAVTMTFPQNSQSESNAKRDGNTLCRHRSYSVGFCLTLLFVVLPALRPAAAADEPFRPPDVPPVNHSLPPTGDTRPANRETQTSEVGGVYAAAECSDAGCGESAPSQFSGRQRRYDAAGRAFYDDQHGVARYHTMPPGRPLVGDGVFGSMQRFLFGWPDVGHPLTEQCAEQTEHFLFGSSLYDDGPDNPPEIDPFVLGRGKEIADAGIGIFSADLLFLTRGGDSPAVRFVEAADPANTRLFNLGQLDHDEQPGVRVTLGQGSTRKTRFEISYFGFDDWTTGFRVVDTAGTPSSPTLRLDARGDYRAELHNVEINIRRFRRGHRVNYWGLLGLRYSGVADSIHLTGSYTDGMAMNPVTGSEDFQVEADNKLYGFQGGIGGNVTVGTFQLRTTAKLGLAVNRFSQQGLSAPPFRIDGSPDASFTFTDNDLVTFGELEALLIWKLNDHIYLRGGYHLVSYHDVVHATRVMGNSAADPAGIRYRGFFVGFMVER